MSYDFDLQETEVEEQKTPKPTSSPSSSSTPTDELKWLPLQNHPVFSTAVDGGGSSSSILAASPSKVMRLDVQLTFVVNKISINKSGSALPLVGSDGLSIMCLYGRITTKDGSTICRTVSIGSQIYFIGNNVIRTLQISWHPYSDTHVGILSFDSVFRLFDLSSALGQPEQEYYLQPVEPGRCRNAASICPVDFSFGGDHLWDRFSVFVLFSDDSVYILCPVVPFGRDGVFGALFWDACRDRTLIILVIAAAASLGLSIKSES